MVRIIIAFNINWGFTILTGIHSADLNVPTDDSDYKATLALVCPIAGVALVVVIVIALVIGCPVMKLIKGRMHQHRADELYDRAATGNLTDGQKEEFVNEGKKYEEKARMGMDGEESEGEEVITNESQPHSILTSEDTTQL